VRISIGGSHTLEIVREAEIFNQLILRLSSSQSRTGCPENFPYSDLFDTGVTITKERSLKGSQKNERLYGSVIRALEFEVKITSFK